MIIKLKTMNPIMVLRNMLRWTVPRVIYVAGKACARQFIVKVGASRTDCKELLHGVKRNGFMLATTITRALAHDWKSVPYFTLASCHTKELLS
jgi:hypothetical protein